MEVTSAARNAVDSGMVQVPVVRSAFPVPTPVAPSDDLQARKVVVAVREKAMWVWEQQQQEKPARKRHRPNKQERQARQRKGGACRAGAGGWAADDAGRTDWAVAKKLNSIMHVYMSAMRG